MKRRIKTQWDEGGGSRAAESDTADEEKIQALKTEMRKGTGTRKMNKGLLLSLLYAYMVCSKLGIIMQTCLIYSMQERMIQKGNFKHE
jgi:hypothetical protein